jgi:hypothetical protein
MIVQPGHREPRDHPVRGLGCLFTAVRPYPPRSGAVGSRWPRRCTPTCHRIAAPMSGATRQVVCLQDLVISEHLEPLSCVDAIDWIRICLRTAEVGPREGKSQPLSTEDTPRHLAAAASLQGYDSAMLGVYDHHGPPARGSSTTASRRGDDRNQQEGQRETSSIVR